MTLNDVAIAARILLKCPGYTLTAVITIALGRRASTTIFSVTNAVLLRPLPYRDPGKLVIAGTDLRKRDVHDLPFSNADYVDLRDGTKGVLSDTAGGIPPAAPSFPRKTEHPNRSASPLPPPTSST